MSRKAQVIQFVLCVLAALAAAKLAHGQELLIGQVSSQTSPVTAMNAKGLYAGINVYFEHVNATGASTAAR